MVRLRTRRRDGTADTVAPEVYPVEPEDHGLHVGDEVCARCHRPFRPTDEARRRSDGACVHLSC